MYCKQWIGVRIGLCWSLALLCGSFAACDRTEDLVRSGDGKDGSGKKLTSSSVSALQIIEECKQAYQKLNTYQDDAYVRLAYRMKAEGQSEGNCWKIARRSRSRCRNRVCWDSCIQYRSGAKRWSMAFATARFGKVGSSGPSHQSCCPFES